MPGCRGAEAHPASARWHDQQHLLPRCAYMGAWAPFSPRRLPDCRHCAGCTYAPPEGRLGRSRGELRSQQDLGRPVCCSGMRLPVGRSSARTRRTLCRSHPSPFSLVGCLGRSPHWSRTSPNRRGGAEGWGKAWCPFPSSQRYRRQMWSPKMRCSCSGSTQPLKPRRPIPHPATPPHTSSIVASAPDLGVHGVPRVVLPARLRVATGR